MFKKKAATRPEINLLELIPAHNIAWERDEEGFILILKPKYQNPILAKLLLPRMKRPYFRIRLDAVGSSFWEYCDARRTVKEIADLQHAKFGAEIEPLYDRIAKFLATLERNRFIRLEGK